MSETVVFQQEGWQVLESGELQKAQDDAWRVGESSKPPLSEGIGISLSRETKHHSAEMDSTSPRGDGGVKGVKTPVLKPFFRKNETNSPSTPPTPSSGPLLNCVDHPSHLHSDQIRQLLCYLVSLELSGNRTEIQNFVCAFGSFGISKCALFCEIVDLLKKASIKKPKKNMVASPISGPLRTSSLPPPMELSPDGISKSYSIATSLSTPSPPLSPPKITKNTSFDLVIQLEAALGDSKSPKHKLAHHPSPLSSRGFIPVGIPSSRSFNTDEKGEPLLQKQTNELGEVSSTPPSSLHKHTKNVASVQLTRGSFRQSPNVKTKTKRKSLHSPRGSGVKRNLSEIGTSSDSRETLIYLFQFWLSSSGAFYQSYFPKLFRKFAEFLGSRTETDLNGLKLSLLKIKSSACLHSTRSALKQLDKEKIILGTFRDEEIFKPFLFDRFSVHEIAEAITFVMFRIYRDIAPSELHDGSWQGKLRKKRAPHIHLLSCVFNHISFLCVVEVLFAPSLDMSILAFKKCIQLGKTLRKMHNFEGMAAVASVLSNASIQRIKSFWRGLEPNETEDARKLEKIVQPKKNFKVYKDFLSSASPPLLPWLAPKLREMRYMYDGNEKLTDENLNYDFLQMAGGSINQYLRHKLPLYKLSQEPSEELVNHLENVFIFDSDDALEDKLYSQSLILYPLKGT